MNGILVDLGIGQTIKQVAATAKGVNDDLHHLKYLERAKSKSF
jgi:predicted Zn-dependent protease